MSSLWLFEPTELPGPFPDRGNYLGHGGTRPLLDQSPRNSAARVGTQLINDLGFHGAEGFQNPFAGIFIEVAGHKLPGAMIAMLGRPGLIILPLDDVPSVAARPGEIKIAITI
jgi:hypothetical protein